MKAKLIGRNINVGENTIEYGSKYLDFDLPEKYASYLYDEEKTLILSVTVSSKNSNKRNYDFENYVLYKGDLYFTDPALTEDEKGIAVKRLHDKHYAEFDDTTNYQKINNEKRDSIPRIVQREVWRRDGGKCVFCGSQEKLEFDHMIPLAKGGANTVRNIQLLCEKCNRTKSKNI